MALKDWKANKYIPLWENKINGRQIFIERNGKNFLFLLLSGKKLDDIIFEKDFKTKQQALKYAKEYMRKH